MCSTQQTVKHFDLFLAKGQGQRSKSQRSKPNLSVSGLQLQFEFTYSYEMMHKGWSSIEEVPYCFSRSSFKVTQDQKNRRFWPKLGVSRLILQFEFTNDYEMMHKAWSRLGEVPYCFSRSSVKFQGHMARKIDFDLNWAFPDCNSSFIHRWLWSDAQSFM